MYKPGQLITLPDKNVYRWSKKCLMRSVTENACIECEKYYGNNNRPCVKRVFTTEFGKIGEGGLYALSKNVKKCFELAPKIFNEKNGRKYSSFPMQLNYNKL